MLYCRAPAHLPLDQENDITREVSGLSHNGLHLPLLILPISGDLLLGQGHIAGQPDQPAAVDSICEHAYSKALITY